MMSLPHARYPRENIAAEPGMLPWWRTLQFTILSTNGKDSKRSSAQPCITLIESLQTFPGDESFQFQLNLKNEVFPYFFLRFSLRSSLKYWDPSHKYYLSFSSFSFSAVRADHLPQSVLQIRPWNQTTTTVHKIRPRSDHHNRQSDESQIRPQIRPCTNSHIRPSSDQTTRSDQPTDYHPWLLHFKSAQHTQPREMLQVRCIVCGLGQGGYIELWMNLAKHTFHTRSAWSFRTSFPA